MTRSERFLHLGLALLCAALLPYCGGRASDSGSSESHFLVPCDATCPEGMTCVCGVCTAPCDTDTACNDLGTTAVCVPPSCDESDAPARGCDVICDGDADCSTLGGDYRCDAGRCRKAPSGGGSGTCLDDAVKAMRTFVSQNKACEVDADCVRVDTPCFTDETCSSVANISASHDADVLRQLQSDLLCTGDCGACVRTLPPPACVDGECTFAGSPSELTCDERSAEASATVQAAVESADRTCSSDADCVSIDNSSDCFYSCGAIVSVTGAETVRAAIDELNSGLCATFADDGCTAFPPPCPFPGNPACIGGQCAANLP